MFISLTMFCPKCNSLMYPKEGKLFCRKCNIENEMEKINIKVKKTEKELTVITEKLDILPKTRIECPKCKNNEAYWHLRQTRSADEPETRIYRCTKCSNTWREY